LTVEKIERVDQKQHEQRVINAAVRFLFGRPGLVGGFSFHLVFVEISRLTARPTSTAGR
jgi:hypothetical protein